ncbi:MAG: hypothetical protein E4G94_08930 [ANME-2 cluster archaeon]|nr:MAG: hypothetical protein E4G94_08930 [ANME-2 cluster archaeon]
MFWVVFGSGVSIPGRIGGDTYIDVSGSPDNVKEYDVTIKVHNGQNEVSLTGTLNVGIEHEH